MPHPVVYVAALFFGAVAATVMYLNHSNSLSCDAHSSYSDRRRRRRSFGEVCPICLEGLDCSTSTVKSMICGHSMHASCYVSFMAKGLKVCPICRHAL